ncbi:WD40/YVTN/BNR-like repeat-containing protein [Pontibacter sp. JAM-7]|uniref:WD40/YVTN/BNR-like repeat-containing protein n=1 Tax=Pontibacter sp. JAM-7 TaxID=3366581 RepID=UPI003AF8A871
MMLVLTGCEAPLNLEGVNQELHKEVRRTDQFQALATNDQGIYAVGNDGLVMIGDKHTARWQRSAIPGEPPLIDIAACPDQSLMALSIHRQVWRSTDNATSWQAMDVDTSEDLMAVACAPDNSVWVVGSFSTILHSADAGQSWQEQSLNEDAMLTGIEFLDSDNLIVSGEFGLLVHSTDGGVSWNEPQYIPDDFYAHATQFMTPQEGWVGGLSGKILYTRDGGSNWEQQSTPTESPIYGFLRTDTSLFAFGDHSTLLQYQGGAWSSVNFQHPPVYLRAAMQLPDHTVLLAGGAGSLLSLDINGDQARLTQK